jgi:hypothetical protein
LPLRAAAVIRSITSMIALAVLAGCGDDEPTRSPDFCDEAPAECLDENNLRTCQGTTWQVISCAAWCDANGTGIRSQGCLRLIDRSDECACSGSRP